MLHKKLLFECWQASSMKILFLSFKISLTQQGYLPLTKVLELIPLLMVLGKNIEIYEQQHEINVNYIFVFKSTSVEH